MVGIWGHPVLYNCGKYDEFDISDLENTTVSEGNVVEVAMALTDVTEELGEGGITADDISNIADVIVDIVDVESNDSQVSKDYVFFNDGWNMSSLHLRLNDICMQTINYQHFHKVGIIVETETLPFLVFKLNLYQYLTNLR